MSRTVLLGLLAALAGCAITPPETAEERSARLHGDCASAGFTKDSEAFRLCLLIRSQDERLAVMERRLSIIEQQQRLPLYPYPAPYRYLP